MSDSVAVVWVHYYTPDLLRESIRAVQYSLRHGGSQGDLIVVNNGGGVEAEGARVVDSGGNVGYAAGVNRGLAETTAPYVLVMNPDVLVDTECIPRLLEMLRYYDIAAPTLFWDRDYSFQLPPTEERDFLSLMIAEMGRRYPGWTSYARRRWRRHAYQHWQAQGIFRSYCLSGAVLSFRREAFHAVGPWCEQYKLYFEETEWLRRARAKNRSAVLVPDARAVHLYAQSSRKQVDASRWFAESQRRYEWQHYSSWQNLFLKLLRTGPEIVIRRPCSSPKAPDVSAWVEASPFPCGYPASRKWVREPPSCLPGIQRILTEYLAGAPYWLRWVDRTWREYDIPTVGP